MFLICQEGSSESSASASADLAMPTQPMLTVEHQEAVPFPSR